MGPSCQLGHRQRADCHFHGQLFRLKVLKVNHHGGVNNPARFA